jgi:hypothetical protein
MFAGPMAGFAWPLRARTETRQINRFDVRQGRIIHVCPMMSGQSRVKMSGNDAPAFV